MQIQHLHQWTQRLPQMTPPLQSCSSRLFGAICSLPFCPSCLSVSFADWCGSPEESRWSSPWTQSVKCWRFALSQSSHHDQPNSPRRIPCLRRRPLVLSAESLIHMRTRPAQMGEKNKVFCDLFLFSSWQLSRAWSFNLWSKDKKTFLHKPHGDGTFCRKRCSSGMLHQTAVPQQSPLDFDRRIREEMPRVAPSSAESDQKFVVEPCFIFTFFLSFFPKCGNIWNWKCWETLTRKTKEKRPCPVILKMAVGLSKWKLKCCLISGCLWLDENCVKTFLILYCRFAKSQVKSADRRWLQPSQK